MGQRINTDNSFAVNFREAGGLHLLFTVLESAINALQQTGLQPFLQCHERQVSLSSAQSELNSYIKTLMNCIHKLMDSKEGIRLTLTHPNAVSCLFRITCDCHSAEIRQLGLRILAILCLLPPKYFAIGSIMTALDTYAQTKGISRFHALLQIGKSVLPKKDDPLQADAMQFLFNI